MARERMKANSLKMSVAAVVVVVVAAAVVVVVELSLLKKNYC